MPVKDRSGQINVLLDPELLAEIRRFTDERGQTLQYFFTRASRRHLDNPPPVPLPDPPLPDSAPDPAPKRAKKPGRKPGAGRG